MLKSTVKFISLLVIINMPCFPGKQEIRLLSSVHAANSPPKFSDDIRVLFHPISLLPSMGRGRKLTFMKLNYLKFKNRLESNCCVLSPRISTKAITRRAASCKQFLSLRLCTKAEQYSKQLEMKTNIGEKLYLIQRWNFIRFLGDSLSISHISLSIAKKGMQRGTAGYRNKCVKRKQDANYMAIMLAGNEWTLSKIWSFSATCVTAAPDDTYSCTNCFLLLQQISSMVFKGGENRFLFICWSASTQISFLSNDD